MSIYATVMFILVPILAAVVLVLAKVVVAEGKRIKDVTDKAPKP